MYHMEKTCCTCLNKNAKELVNASELDSDMMRYIDKLKSCINMDLQEFDLLCICGACRNQLDITYNFLEKVKATQEILRNYLKNIQTSMVLKNENDYKVVEEHITEETSLHSYQLCGNNFNNVLDLGKHQSSVHILENEKLKRDDKLEQSSLDISEGTDKFNYFPKTLNSISLQQTHTKSSEEDNSIFETETQTCKQCGKLEKTNHKCIPKNAEGFRCEYCGLEFEKKWLMQRHRQRVHTEKTFNCSYCDKAFKQSYHLSEHVRLHTGEMNYECNLCGKKFYRLYSHRRHMRSHQAAPGEKTVKTPFLCSICGKSFPFSNGMERHKRVHLGIKKFECNVCNRRFGQSTHLKVHMRMHTGEKPYICHFCGEGFSLNAKLQKHFLMCNQNCDKERDSSVFVKLESVGNDSQNN